MQMESLSSEECDFDELFCREEHIFWNDPATTAIGGVEIPIGIAKVALFRES
jgi:hypothetical protein